MLLIAFSVVLSGCTDEPKPVDVPSTCDMAAELEAVAYGGISAPIDIRIDEYAIPHITAATDADAFYAAGWMQARDRLFQMEMNRRRVSGQRAEILGADYLSGDQEARLFGFYRQSCESLAALQQTRPEDLELLVAFVAGINARIAETEADPALLPPEFAQYNFTPTRFTPEDSIAIGTAILLGFSNTLEYDLLYTLFTRLTPNYEDVPLLQPAEADFIMGAAAPAGAPAPRRAAAPLDPAEVARSGMLRDLQRLGKSFHNGPGSNNWAVAGRLTEDGRPMLANDTHSGLGRPNTMYMLHMRAPGFDVAGFAFVGVPSVNLGHNRALSWSATTNWADVVDIWDVAVSEGGDTLSLGGTEHAIVTEEQQIPVRQPDGSVVDQPFTLQYVPDQGILLTEELLGIPMGLLTQDALLARWTGFAPNDDLELFLGFDRAETLDGFVAAVEEQDAGMMNWVGATAEGIRYHTSSLVPVRAGAVRPNEILDGDDPASLWAGWLSPDQLPSLDGSQDWIITANNDPWGHTADNDPVNDAFYYGSFYDPGFRAARIDELLTDAAAAGPMTLDDMIRIQNDAGSLTARRMLPLLRASVDRIGADPDLAAWADRADLLPALERLEAWDQQMRRGSAEAALFRAWMAFLDEATLSDDINILFEPVETDKPPYIDKVTMLAHEGGDARYPRLLDGGEHPLRVHALADAIDWLAAQAVAQGVDEITWTELHSSVFTAPDGALSYLPSDGGSDTINSSECGMWAGGDIGTCDGANGPILRQITRFSADGTPELYFNAPWGNDGDIDRWIAGEYVLLPFTEAEIDARTAATLTLE